MSVLIFLVAAQDIQPPPPLRLLFHASQFQRGRARRRKSCRALNTFCSRRAAVRRSLFVCAVRHRTHPVEFETTPSLPRRQPDDSLVDAGGRLPVMLNLPNSNDLEQINGIYRTGLARFRPRNYGWRRLQEALNPLILPAPFVRTCN